MTELDGQGGNGELSESDRRLLSATAPGKQGKGLRRRQRALDGPRDKLVVVRYSPGEYSDISKVTDRLGMEEGAWIGEMSTRYARAEVEPIPPDWRDLGLLVTNYTAGLNVANNLLNQIARTANSTGQFAEFTERQLAIVERNFPVAQKLEAEVNARMRRGR